MTPLVLASACITVVVTTVLGSGRFFDAEPFTAAGVSVLAFGAVGDGVSDDTAALKRALRTGGSLVFPAGGTFLHNDVLEVSEAGTHLSGPGVLLATNEARSSLWIAADDVLVDGGLTFRISTTTRRWSAWEQMRIRLLPYARTTLREITVDGAAAAGIYVGGASDYLLSDVTVQNTRADGIHQTGGAHDGRVVRPVVRNAGDDSVAVVSYDRDPAPCHDITVDSPTSYRNQWGRAFSVVGGHDIDWINVYSEYSDSAGLYLAAEGPPYHTSSTRRVTVTGGRLVGSNTNPGVAHGAVMIYAGRPGAVVDDVVISDMAIIGTRATADADVNIRRRGGAVGDVMMNGFTVTGGPGRVFADGGVPAGAYRLTRWTHNGHALADR